jgi:hypothetical protein
MNIAQNEGNIQPKVSTTVQGSMVVVKKKPAATRKAKAKKNIKRQVPKHQPIATHPTFQTADIRRAVSKNHLQVRVLTTVGQFYVRNNKRSGLKNLRCFPRCLSKGHNRNGFCGRPLNVELQISAREFRKSQFVAYGRFTLADPTGQDNGPIISQFKTYRSLDIMNMTKTKDDNSMPLYKSTPSTNTAGKSHGAIVFRFSPTTWHYGWRSSKHMKDSAHVFRVFCFIVSPDRKLLKCVAVTETSWFTLASSKRVKSTKDVAKKLAAKNQQSQLQLLHAVKLNQYHEMVRDTQMLSNHQQVASFSSTSTMSNKRPAPSDILAGGGGSNKRPRVNMGMGGAVSPAPQPTANKK